MNEITELYNEAESRLLITNISAGSVGRSYETEHPGRKRLLIDLGLIPEKVKFVRQTHSKKVIDASEHSFSPLTEADGIIAGNLKEAIAITVADCMPVFLHDKKRNVRALLHSGWKGTGIALEALEQMRRRYGSSPEDVTAVLGPAIGSCCYNVDRQRAEVFRAEWGDDAVVFRNGEYYLSLENANRVMLSRAGVKNIICSGTCTACSPNFGSFRREGPDNYTLMFVLSTAVDGSPLE